MVSKPLPAPPREPLSPGQWRAGGAGNERNPGTSGGVRGLPEIPRRNHVAGQAAGRLGSKLRARHTNPGCPNPLGERGSSSSQHQIYSPARTAKCLLQLLAGTHLALPPDLGGAGSGVDCAFHLQFFAARQIGTRRAKIAAASPETIMAWRQQERLLAELIGPNETRAAEPPKPFLPQAPKRRAV